MKYNQPMRKPVTKSLRDAMRCPAHPGEVLREDVLRGLNIRLTEFARQLGAHQLLLLDFLLELRSLSPAMATRIAKLTKTSPQSWIKLQRAHDISTKKWLKENKTALDEYNNHMQRHGEFSRTLRRF